MLAKLKKFFGGRRVQLVVGNDLVFVPDVGESMKLFGRRYLDLVFTETELADCSRDMSNPSLHSLAARVAAKEAVMKLLRPRRDEILPWRAIEVRREDTGASTLYLHEPATTLAKRAGIDQLSLTLSHEHQYATAVVIGTSHTI